MEYVFYLVGICIVFCNQRLLIEDGSTVIYAILNMNKLNLKLCKISLQKIKKINIFVKGVDPVLKLKTPQSHL